MQNWYASLSLRTKVTTITVAITILSLVAVATVGILQIGRQIAAEQHRTADSVALGVARASELALTVGDKQELSRLASSFLRDENVLFVAVYGSNANPLATAISDNLAWQQFVQGEVDNGRGVVAAHPIEASAQGNEFTGDPDAEISAGGGSSTQKSPAAGAKILGKVVVCLSTAPTILAKRQQINFTIGATAAAATLCAVVLVLTLNPWMTRLKILADASGAIARGDFNSSISDPHNDEIGQLTRSFDGMRQVVRDRDLQLRQFADTLQEQVRHRTHQLEKALSVAEEASRAKSLFLANMSHELRTPLNGVIGMVDLLLTAEPSPQQRRYCDVAKASARSLLELINDILDFSKIEAGKLELDSTDFNLHEVIESVMQMLGERAQSKGIELICDVSERVPKTVLGDPTRLRQVVLNLITNAIKFTDTGEVVVHARAEEQTDTHTVVKLSVRDSGIGIPPERLARLFKSFSQVDASTTRKYGGTGLGLAISQRIVEMMGGEIGVESEEGKGSTFWIRVKFEIRATPAIAHREIGVDPRGLRALVVDDNATNREILQGLLGSWRLRTEIASCAREALEMLNAASAKGEPYRVAILDMRMPKTDGMELANEIKSNPKTRDTILISLSSIGDPMKVEQMNRMGFAACLTKPALPSQLYDAIVDSLAAHEEPANAAAAAKPAADGSIRLDGVHVLLAEDNAVNRFVASELLASTGCVCTMVVNGREALDTALRESHDVILMDCQMPELDGFEATKAIRAAESIAGNGTHRSIIALTANAIKGDRELCLAAGMDDYVTKPIEPTELFSAIRRQLSAERIAQIAASSPPAAAARETRATDSTEADASPAVDLETLQQRCLGNRKLAAKALKMFESSLAKDIEVLSEGMSKGDARAVAASAHKIKGAAANVSAEQVRAVAADLEKLAKTDALSQAQASLDELDREMLRFKEYLGVALGRLAPQESASAAHAPSPAASHLGNS